MMRPPQLELYRIREIYEVINDTFAFLRQHFNRLSYCLLLFTGPPVLLLVLAEMALFSRVDVTGLGLHSFTQADTPAQLLLAVLLMLVALLEPVLVAATVYQYLWMTTQDIPFSVEAVGRGVWQKMPLLLALTVAYGIGLSLSALCLLLPAVFFSISYAMILVMPFFSPQPTLWGYFQFSTYLLSNKSATFEPAKWTKLFILLFTIGIISFLFSYLLQVPAFLARVFILMFDVSNTTRSANYSNQIFWSIYRALLFLGGIWVSAITLLALAFQYFSFVEQKKAIGLLWRIENLGKSTIFEEDEEDATY